MKKLLALTVLVVVAAAGTGCSTMHDKYKNTGWYTPDGFNYTHALDHEGLKPSQHYFGLSWSLK